MDGKVAIVTGAGQGIGEGIAISLANAGVKVVLVEKFVLKTTKVIETIEASGGKAIPFECDVFYNDQIKKAIQFAVNTFGSIDILINNAQGLVAPHRFEAHTDEEIGYVFGSGFRAYFNFMKECFPVMKAGNYGRIINLASSAGVFGQIGTLAYAANKEAIRAMTRVAAREWGKYNICVNNLCPMTMTPSMQEIVSEKQIEYATSRMAIPRFSTIEECGDMVVFLCKNNYLTGYTFFLDGGYCMDTSR